MSNLNLFRPSNLIDFVGNKELVSSLKVSIYSAKKRNVSLDHILLYGNSGCGKTTLAHIIANELGRKIKCYAAPLIEKISDIVSILGEIEAGDIVFIDEIHRLPKEVIEVLYGAMEDFEISLSYKSSEGTKNILLDIPPFTLIGATTLIGKLSFPFRNRFGITYKLDYYSIEEISLIISKNISKLHLKIDNEGIKSIAKRSRNTPRIANNLLRRIYDYSIYFNKDYIDLDLINEYFNSQGIDELGLDRNDYSLIKAIYEKYNNRPLSVDTIAITLSETKENILEVYEPYLIRIGILERTKLGRRLTSYGIEFYKKNIMKKD